MFQGTDISGTHNETKLNSYEITPKQSSELLAILTVGKDVLSTALKKSL